MITDKKRVKDANKKFYNLAADIYEQADGRRGEGVASGWLDLRLERLSGAEGRKKKLLDVGCGTGFVLRKAQRYFAFSAGVDISEKVLLHARQATQNVCCSDVDSLPFSAESFDVVTSIAVLHHLVEHKNLFQEIHRVLKPGGVFYSDHDLDRRFNQIFRMPLGIYRMIRNSKKRYIDACPELTSELYELSEIHEHGLDVKNLEGELRGCGFKDVTLFFHWTGLAPLFDKIQESYGRERSFPHGLAPSFSLMATK